LVIDINNLETCDIENIRNESLEEGHNMINRLVTEYRSGENRFDKPGEKLVGYIMDNETVALCGLNIEPMNNRFGRIGRLYVSKDYRHRKIGTALVSYLIEHAKKYFESVVVNIGDLPVDDFYKSAGFSPVDNESYTHIYGFTE
jgi:GNAT superfamily N-acetyltransferase